MPKVIPSASERAYEKIRREILDGTHVPGTMLGEAALASSLGVSRTPVRVALARLQDEGWITVYPKRGALVMGLSDAAVADLADARYVLETTAVDRAPDALRRELADSLDASIAEQRDAFRDDDLPRFVELTLQFHRGFVRSGGNSVLLELYDRLSDRHRFMLFASGDRLRERRSEIIDEHRQLAEHLRAGDVASFAAVLRDHIAEVPAERSTALSAIAATASVE